MRHLFTVSTLTMVLASLAMAAPPIKLPEYPGSKRYPGKTSFQGSKMPKEMKGLVKQATNMFKTAEQYEGFVTTDSLDKLLAFYEAEIKKLECKQTSEFRHPLKNSVARSYACGEGAEMRILSVEVSEGAENFQGALVGGEKIAKKMNCAFISVVRPAAQ